MAPRLPPFPAIEVQVVEDTTSRPRCDEGFVHARRPRLRLVSLGGQPGRVFDRVARQGLLHDSMTGLGLRRLAEAPRP